MHLVNMIRGVCVTLRFSHVKGALMSEFEWLEFPHEALWVHGLWWFDENAPELWRLPARLQDKVRGEVWRIGTYPSGGRIRFASDTAALAVRARWETPGNMHNMCAIGRMGIDLFMDGKAWLPVWPEEAGEREFVFFGGAEAKMREFTLHLPLYHAVNVLAVGFTPGAKINPPAPFVVEKPVAFYGSSITQGGCATRPGMSYQAILSRMLNIDFVNLGFSGQGRGEPEMAQAFAEIDASVFVVDFAQNCPTVEELDERYAPFLETVRAAHPDVPIICITPIFSTREVSADERLAQNPAKREVIRRAVTERQEAGDANITLVEGLSLLGETEGHATVDGSHPSDLGFNLMAGRLAPAVESALSPR